MVAVFINLAAVINYLPNYSSSNPFLVDMKENLIIHVSGIVNATPSGGIPD